MPRFYLHVCNGSGFVEDEEGQELPDLESAREQAIQGLRDIMAGDLRAGELNMASFIEVEDEARQLLTTVNFLEAVSISSQPCKPRRA